MPMSVIFALFGFGILLVATLVMLYRLGALRLQFSPAIGLLGAWAIFMAVDTVIGRLLIETDGTVVSRQTIPKARPNAIYTMRAPGGDIFTFTSGASDASLPRDFLVGSHVTKRKWDLSYTVNGQRISNFPVTFYGVLSGIGASLVWFSVVLLIQQRCQPGLTKRCSRRLAAVLTRFRP